MKRCPKCGRMTAEESFHDGSLNCYARDCGHEGIPERPGWCADCPAVLALRDVVDPIGQMKREMPEGSRLNHLAVRIADDPGHLRSIAKEALRKIKAGMDARAMGELHPDPETDAEVKADLAEGLTVEHRRISVEDAAGYGDGPPLLDMSSGLPEDPKTLYSLSNHILVTGRPNAAVLADAFSRIERWQKPVAHVMCSPAIRDHILSLGQADGQIGDPSDHLWGARIVVFPAMSDVWVAVAAEHPRHSLDVVIVESIPEGGA